MAAYIYFDRGPIPMGAVFGFLGAMILLAGGATDSPFLGPWPLLDNRCVLQIDTHVEGFSNWNNSAALPFWPVQERFADVSSLTRLMAAPNSQLGSQAPDLHGAQLNAAEQVPNVPVLSPQRAVDFNWPALGSSL
eukprot:6475715-Amphidinium_carterae.1